MGFRVEGRVKGVGLGLRSGSGLGVMSGLGLGLGLDSGFRVQR